MNSIDKKKLLEALNRAEAGLRRATTEAFEQVSRVAVESVPPPETVFKRAPVANEELAQWATTRADDAGYLAREVLKLRRLLQEGLTVIQWYSGAETEDDGAIAKEFLADYAKEQNK